MNIETLVKIEGLFFGGLVVEGLVEKNLEYVGWSFNVVKWGDGQVALWATVLSRNPLTGEKAQTEHDQVVVSMAEWEVLEREMFARHEGGYDLIRALHHQGLWDWEGMSEADKARTLSPAEAYVRHDS